MPRAGSSPPTTCGRCKYGRRVSLAGLVLIRQRPGSAKGVCFITLEDETGVANLVVWPDAFTAQRKVVMGARLMVIHGLVQHDEAVVHVVARTLEDDSAMLRAISDEAMPSTLSAGDGAGSWRAADRDAPAQRAVHPQEPRFSLSANVRFGWKADIRPTYRLWAKLALGRASR